MPSWPYQLKRFHKHPFALIIVRGNNHKGSKGKPLDTLLNLHMHTSLATPDHHGHGDVDETK
jgi:hypothetical protein